MKTPVYDYIPKLRELIKNNGIPGVQYAIIAQESHLRAQEEDWEELAGGTKVFIIRGPKGQAACKLLGRGRPITGQQMGSYSKVYVDRRVRELTGLDDKPELTVVTKPKS